MASTKLKAGLTAFMTASITTSHAVYRDTTAEITYTDDFNNLSGTAGSSVAVDCWMVDYELNQTGTSGLATTCDAATKTITISKMKYSSTGRSFTFRVLATFAASVT